MRPLILIALFVLPPVLGGCQYAQKVYYQQGVGEDTLLFTSFRHKEERDMYLLASRNGYAWYNLGSVLKTTEFGLRDPKIVRGPDGVYHAVWTTGRPRSIGYASSKDLLEWTTPRLIEVMAGEPNCRNAWAPEIHYNESSGQWLILWSSTVTGRFEGTVGGDGWNHRIYACTTRDFRTLSRPFLMFDPGYSVIDASIVVRGGKHYLFYKNESVVPGKPAEAGASKAEQQTVYTDYIEYAEGPGPRGPWTNIRRPLGTQSVEAPAPVEVGDRLYVYYDFYSRGKYGAMFTEDMDRWVETTTAMTFPEGHRHGSAFHVSPEVFQRLLDHALETGQIEASSPLISGWGQGGASRP